MSAVTLFLACTILGAFVLVVAGVAWLVSGLGDMVDDGDDWPTVVVDSSKRRNMRKRPK